MVESLRKLGDGKWLNFRKAVFLASCFLVLFIAFNSAQNIITEVTSQNGYGAFGFRELGIMHLATAITALFSSVIVGKLGLGRSLFIGSLGFLTFLIAQIFPNWSHEDQAKKDEEHKGSVPVFLQSDGFVYILCCISMVLNGCGASILWVAQGKYFSKCATNESRGFYFGLFWSIYQGSQIFGNLFSALLFYEKVANVGKTVFHLVMTGIAIIAVIGFRLVQKPFVHSGVNSRKEMRLSNQSCYFSDGGNDD